MEKYAPKVFIFASLLFGILGLLNIFIEPAEDTILFKLFIATVFVILPSFALSVASRYLIKKP